MKYALRIRPRRNGFTLVELMIAMTISLFLLIGIASVTMTHSTSSRELEKTSRQIETGRYAMQVVGDDLTLAGFYGTFSPKGATVSTPDPCATAVVNLGFDNASSPITVPAPVYGYVGAAVSPTCLANRLAGTGIVVVRRVSSTAIVVASAAAGQTYVQASGCDSDPKVFVIDTNSASFTLHQKDCTAIAPLRSYLVRVYYVGSCNVCSGGNADTTPTLKVAEFTGGAINIVPLAEGVQDLQSDYGIDLDNDGSADCYVADPGVDNAATCGAGWPAAPGWSAPLQNWGNVVTVRLHVLARNVDQTSDWTDARTYDMGRAGITAAANDHYKRHTYSAVLRVANVAGMREQ